MASSPDGGAAAEPSLRCCRPRRAMGGANFERRVPSSTSWGSSPNFSSAARAAAFLAAKRSEEHTSELQSLMRISYAVFCLKKKKEYGTPNTTGSTRDRVVTTKTTTKSIHN